MEVDRIDDEKRHTATLKAKASLEVAAGSGIGPSPCREPMPPDCTHLESTPSGNRPKFPKT